MAQFVKHPLIRENAVEEREYQSKISAEVLAKGNTLAVAPTALGKTIVAIVLAVELVKKDPNAKIVFLAPTKPLAEQHKKSFEKKTLIEKDKIVLLTGSVPIETRKKLFEQATIISATPQTIRNDLKRKRISMDKVALCIFDEAHRAIGEYSYVYIAKRYMEQRAKPLILALTASPGSQKKKIEKVCENLFVKNIEVKTAQDEDVKPYVNEIKTEWVKVKLPAEFLKIKRLLENFSKEQMVLLRRMGLVPTTNMGFMNKRRQLELQDIIRKRIQRYGKRQPSLFAAASKLAALMKSSHALLLLETQGISSLNDYLDRTQKGREKENASKALKSFLNHKGVQEAIIIAKKLEKDGIDHPKILELKCILIEQFKSHPESRAIVFNHYRSSIKRLVEVLKEEDEIKPKRFIGQASRGKDKGMSQKEQIEVIEELKEGKYNCLIASSVAEEGLDIPTVDLVVFYEPVPSEIRSIQRRGRTGRLDKGRVVVLMAEGTRDEAFYWVSQHKEKRMHRTLKNLKQDGEQDKQKTLQGWYNG
tara:strand:+ start:695 stop:2293 length:1599 start_codon:yes stop_codon:yes gene_type:complete